MSILLIFYFFLLGTLFWSFASVLIFRLKSWEKGIIKGRSQCKSCKKKLTWKDLFPLFSWIFLRGKCRHCDSEISVFYPLLELTMWLFFAASLSFVDISLLLQGNFHEILRLVYFQILAFLVVLFSFYDIKYLEIHDKTLWIGIFLTFIALLLQTFTSFSFFDFLPQNTLPLNENLILITTFLSFIALFYLILFAELRIIWDILILVSQGGILILLSFFLSGESSLFPSLVAMYAIFTFFALQIFISGGRWLGGGDLRIAILFGMILGPLAFLGMMLTYIIGSILGILFVLIQYFRQRIPGKKVDTTLPFWPFLALGLYATLFFHENILGWYEKFFLFY